MLEQIQNSLKKGLAGAHSHINPLDAISDIDADLARKRLNEDSHSIWDILYHLVIWQDIFIENIKGKEADWEVQSWLTNESKLENEEFYNLKEKFKAGLLELKNLIEYVNLAEGLSFWHNDPVVQFVVVAITHNSYHTGQILYLKKILS